MRLWCYSNQPSFLKSYKLLPLLDKQKKKKKETCSCEAGHQKLQKHSSENGVGASSIVGGWWLCFEFRGAQLPPACAGWCGCRLGEPSCAVQAPSCSSRAQQGSPASLTAPTCPQALLLLLILILVGCALCWIRYVPWVLLTSRIWTSQIACAFGRFSRIFQTF